MNAIKMQGSGYIVDPETGLRTCTKLAPLVQPVLSAIPAVNAETEKPMAVNPLDETYSGDAYIANYYNLPIDFAGALVDVSVDALKVDSSILAECSCSIPASGQVYNYFYSTAALHAASSEEAASLVVVGGTSMIAGLTQHLDFSPLQTVYGRAATYTSTNSQTLKLYPGFLEPMVGASFPNIAVQGISTVSSALDGLAVAVRSLNNWKTLVDADIQKLKRRKMDTGLPEEGYGVLYMYGGSIHVYSGPGAIFQVDGGGGVVSVDSTGADPGLVLAGGGGGLTLVGVTETGLIQALNGAISVLPVPDGMLFGEQGTITSVELSQQGLLAVTESGNITVETLTSTGLVTASSGNLNVVPFGEGYAKGTGSGLSWIAPGQCEQ